MIQSEMINSTLYFMDKERIRAERVNRGILDCFGIYYSCKKSFIRFHKENVVFKYTNTSLSNERKQINMQWRKIIRTRHIFLLINYNF